MERRYDRDFKIIRVQVIEGLLTKCLLTGKTMGISIKNTILFLAVISSVFISLPEAKGGCAGSCSVSGGGGSSTSFMGDRTTNVDMSSFDEFVRDKLGGDPAKLQAKSLSQETRLSGNPSLNQTGNGNSSRNSSAVMLLTNDTENATSDNGPIKLGASGRQDYRLSTLIFATFNSN